jgi:hypothetical protein
MKRMAPCTIIMACAVSMALFLTGIVGTQAAAAFSVEAARQKLLEEDRKKEEARHAEIVRNAKNAEFIAISESDMNYADALAFCKRHGGRLPRINNSDSWDGRNPLFQGILIDGFGYGARPWSEIGLPYTYYWTGTEVSDIPGYSWIVHGYGGINESQVGVNNVGQSHTIRVVCVP